MLPASPRATATIFILDKINFTLSAGERAGLIGPNGAGKSTLLRIIAGVESPDKGSVWIDPAARLGYLSQALVYAPDGTVGTVMHEAMGPALEAVAAIERLGEALAVAAPDDADEVMARYAAALDEAERLDAYGAPARLAAVLAGLGLAHLDTETPVAILSGNENAPGAADSHRPQHVRAVHPRPGARARDRHGALRRPLPRGPVAGAVGALIMSNPATSRSARRARSTASSSRRS